MREITSIDLDLLAAAWLRLPGFFRESTMFVRPQHFDQAREGGYLVLWLTLEDLYRRYTEVTSEMVLHTAYSMVESGQIPLNQTQVDDLLTPSDAGLVVAAFNMNVQSLHLPHCRDVLRHFLQERSVLWPLRRMANSTGAQGSRESLDTVIEQLSLQQRRITTAGTLPTRPPAPSFGDPMQAASVYRLTGSDWIDRQLRGQREGDVNGFLGFQGAGKSLFAGQMTVSSARQSFAEQGANAGWSVLFTYEEPLRKVEPRLRSAAMRIDRNKLDTMTDWRELTTPGNLAHYERNMGSCERERWDQHRDWFNNTVRAFDMSGSEDFPTNGTGGVNEIEGILDSLQNETGRPIRTVVIDWAIPLVERSMEAKNVKQELMRNQLAKLGDELRRKVSERFRTTTWITHQLRSDASTSPTKLHKHTDAMECKSFCAHMAFCGALSYPDDATGVRRFHWPKHRAAANDALQPIMLRPNSHIAEFDDVSNLFTVDNLTQSIVETRQARQVLGVPG